MQYQIFKASPALQPFVHFYWFLEKSVAEQNQGYCQRIVPNGFMELTINYGEPVSVIKKNSFEKLPQVFIAGQNTGYFDIATSGNTGFITVLLKPQAARFFFNFPLTELTNCHINLADISKNENDMLVQTIAATPEYASKVEIVEKFLWNKINEKVKFNFFRIQAAMEKINLNFGNARLSELASVACLGEKQFQRVFMEHVGLSPKQFMRVVRLQYAFFQVQKAKAKNITELAYSCGYYDQAHFVNDCKLLTGLTPSSCFENKAQVFSDYFSVV